jgi:hypothetical protein
MRGWVSITLFRHSSVGMRELLLAPSSLHESAAMQDRRIAAPNRSGIAGRDQLLKRMTSK